MTRLLCYHWNHEQIKIHSYFFLLLTSVYPNPVHLYRNRMRSFDVELLIPI